ncbi:MAG: hypothetical protein H7Z77_11145, partial [Chitinophagaceae bacterium]|nr:hypothetical protein [Polaromonas sp.]
YKRDQTGFEQRLKQIEQIDQPIFVTCTAATVTASCASLAAVTPAFMQGSGIVLNFPASSSYTFTVTCGVNATGLP